MQESEWKQAVGSKTFVLQACLTLTTLVLLAIFTGPFFGFVQSVKGTQLADPVLMLLPAQDVSFTIFTLLYGGIVAAFVYLGQHPFLLLQAGGAYAILTLLRICTLYLFPLEPPTDIIPLKDFFVDRLFYDNRLITKDLFFSGHTATLALLVIVVRKVYLKFILGVIAVAVGTLLLVQHAHYSVDVIAAPIFAWISVYFFKAAFRS